MAAGKMTPSMYRLVPCHGKRGSISPLVANAGQEWEQLEELGTQRCKSYRTHWWTRLGRQRGKAIRKTRVNGRAFTQWRSQVLCQSLFPCWCVLHSTEITVSRSHWDSYGSFLHWTVAGMLVIAKMLTVFFWLEHDLGSGSLISRFVLFFCSHVLSCLILTFYLLLTCAPSVFSFHPVFLVPLVCLIPHNSLVITVWFSASFHLHLIPLLVWFVSKPLLFSQSVLVLLFPSSCAPSVPHLFPVV